MKMLKFERKRSGSSNVYNVLLQKWESIRMLEFVWKLRNRSEYWNLRTKWESIKMLKFECYIVKIYQNVDIWVKSWKTIKKLMFQCNKVRIDQNIEIWVQHSGINQNVEIWTKKGRLIKCWYFLAKVWIDQNVGIWLQNKELIRILKLRTKLGINQNVEIWVLTIKSFKMLYFEWKVRNQFKKLTFECNKVAIGDVDNSKRPLLIIPKVQLHLRITSRSVTALARYPQKLAKIVCG